LILSFNIAVIKLCFWLINMNLIFVNLSLCLDTGEVQNLWNFVSATGFKLVLADRADLQQLLAGDSGENEILVCTRVVVILVDGPFQGEIANVLVITLTVG